MQRRQILTTGKVNYFICGTKEKRRKGQVNASVNKVTVFWLMMNCHGCIYQHLKILKQWNIKQWQTSRFFFFFPLGYEPLLNSHYEVEKWIVVGKCSKKTRKADSETQKKERKNPLSFCLLHPTPRYSFKWDIQVTNRVINHWAKSKQCFINMQWLLSTRCSSILLLMIVLIHCVLWDVNLHPALCTLFEVCILNDTDTFTFVFHTWYVMVLPPSLKVRNTLLKL